MKFHTKLNLNYNLSNINYYEDDIKIIYNKENNTKLSYNIVLDEDEDISYGNNNYNENLKLFENINKSFYCDYIKTKYSKFFEEDNCNLFGFYIFNQTQVNELLDLFKNNITEYDIFIKNLKIYNVLCNTNDLTLNTLKSKDFVRTSDFEVIKEIHVNNDNNINEDINTINNYLTDKYNCYSNIDNNLNTSKDSIKEEVQKYLDVIPDIHNKLNINDTRNDTQDEKTEKHVFDTNNTTVIINDKNEIEEENDNTYNNKNNYSNMLWSMLGLEQRQ